jgi:TolB-like protein
LKRYFHRKCIALVVVPIFLLALSGELSGAQGVAQTRTVAIMPFGTFAVGDLSIDITRLLAHFLEKNRFNVIPDDILEGFLIKRRIRGADFLDRPAVREMGTALKVDALMVGSVDLLAGGENPRVAMNAQMIDCLDASVMWANSVSRTGEDFATFLGLGKVTSLEKLVKMAAEELLNRLPRGANMDDSPVTPFEVTHASFFPNVLRGGENTRVSIEVREITGKKLEDIRAFILDKQIELKIEGPRWYSGTIKAPAVEGVYPLRIYLTDRWNRLFKVDAVASVTVHNTPPEVALSFPQRLLSPNNDGINDYIRFFAEPLKAIHLDSWRVEITDTGGNILRSEGGFGGLPQGFIWRGRNNEYKTVNDGNYFCRLVVKDRAGNKTVTSKERLVVDTTPPEVQIVLARKNEDGITLDLRATDMTKIADWEFIVYDGDGNEAGPGKLEGKGDIPTTITLGLKKKRKTC